MPFYLESHLHTAPVSPCAQVPPADGVAALHRAGYHGIIVTDHYRSDNLESYPGSDKDHVTAWLTGYRAVRKAGHKHGMVILLGAEITFRGTMEDLLLYGPDEDFFYAHPRLYDMDLPSLYRLAQESGCLLIQAHPFRSYLNVLDPQYLHGVEIVNQNPRHDSHNDRALAFAREHGLLMTGGSDYHLAGDESVAMEFTAPIASNKDFISAVTRGDFRFAAMNKS